jgi:lipoate-protein ligase A
MHDGPMQTTQWSRQICFAGLGPGECLVDGKKVLGISQKRTRAGASFQCSVFTQFEARETVNLLSMDEDRRRQAAEFLNETVGTVQSSAIDIERAFQKTLEKTAL